MAAINIYRPNAVSPVGSTGQVPLVSRTPGSHILDGDFVTLAGGVINSSGNNPATVAGIAAHDSQAVYAGLVTGNAQPALRDVMGHSEVGTPLVPASPSQTLVASVNVPNFVEINLSATTGWVTGGTQQVNIGSAVGLSVDATTGFYVADPTVSNLIATIEDILIGPGFTSGYQSGGPITGVGDTSARVRIRFNPAAVVGS